MFRVYVCESLANAPQGKYLTAHYYDLIQPRKVKTDKRSADEIAADIIRKAGLTIEPV